MVVSRQQDHLLLGPHGQVVARHCWSQGPGPSCGQALALAEPCPGRYWLHLGKSSRVLLVVLAVLARCCVRSRTTDGRGYVGGCRGNQAWLRGWLFGRGGGDIRAGELVCQTCTPATTLRLPPSSSNQPDQPPAFDLVPAQLSCFRPHQLYNERDNEAVKPH